MKFSGSDKCNKDLKILPIFTKCLYFPPYSTQILCTIMFIVLPIYSIHLRFSPVFILAWQNPNLIKPKPLPSSHLLLGSWICLEKNKNPNWSHFDFMVTIPTGFSLQLPGNHITFPNPSIPHSPTKSAHVSFLLKQSSPTLIHCKWFCSWLHWNT